MTPGVLVARSTLAGEHLTGVRRYLTEAFAHTARTLVPETTSSMFAHLPISPQLPHPLEAGMDDSWYIETDEVKRVCAENNMRYQDARAVVHLADGRKCS
jgi:hypothetical protein